MLTLTTRTASLLAFGLLGAAFVSTTHAQKAATPAATQLTAEETKAGWKLLFDGKTLNGWRGYKRPDATGFALGGQGGMLTLPKNDGKDTRGARDLDLQPTPTTTSSWRGTGRSRWAATAA